MSGGMEEAHEDSRKARTDHELNTNNGDNKEVSEEASIENTPKGQVEEVDFQTEAIGDNSKPLSSEWRVPGTTTNFQPSEWIPPPRDGYIDPKSFQGAATSF
jgi:hypothetical protein